MKVFLIVYGIIAFLYFCIGYRNSYKKVRSIESQGFKPNRGSAYILFICLVKAIFFPIDLLLIILRNI